MNESFGPLQKHYEEMLKSKLGGYDLRLILLTKYYLIAAVCVIFIITAAVTANSIFEPVLTTTESHVVVTPNRRK